MRLHFDLTAVRRLLEHARAAPEHRLSYGQEQAGPGLWLVGDQGVYLMSNGKPHLAREGAEQSSVVVYASEVDPTKLPFDQWWEAKRASFGGDDGVEYFPADEVEAAIGRQGAVARGTLVIDVSPTRMVL